MSDAIAPTYTERQVKVAGSKVVIDPSLYFVSIEDLRKALRGSYAEVVNAVPNTFERDGIQYVEFMPKAERKG